VTLWWAASSLRPAKELVERSFGDIAKAALLLGTGREGGFGFSGRFVL
jgi:hypothetical protein